MSITYQTENWPQFIAEARPLLHEHWLEIALGHDKVPLDIAEERYQKLCDDGNLHIATVRDDGQLVGYQVTVVSGHLHYESTLHGIADVYFLQQEHRKGRTGIRLFKYVEQEMMKRGVKKLITGVKLHTAGGRSGLLFERLGYTPTETVFTKLIGD